MSDLSERLRRLMARRPKFLPRAELLLGPGVPHPLHGTCPRIILGQGWWHKERAAAMRSTGYRCGACGVRGVPLEGHEVYEVDERARRSVYVGTVPLCSRCHSYRHRGRLEALWEAGEISHGEYVAVIKHGDRVLREAGLKRPMVEARGTVSDSDWNLWRLVINGVEYPPQIPSAEEWRRLYTNG